MENMMTVAEILDALYDGIGCSWCNGPGFVEEVEAWIDNIKALCDDEAELENL